MAMSCSKASDIADGREIWLMADTPTFFRWENDSATICHTDKDTPFIAQCGGTASLKAQFINFNGNSIKSRSNAKCIAIKKEQIEWKCNSNFKLIPSSTKPDRDNNPCNVANKDKSKPF